jgi:predicted acylesterase/phospholipase RssA
MGAFEAGALYGFLHETNDTSKFQYDVVTGISAGSINTLGVVMWEIGNELNMTKWLSEMWATKCSTAGTYKDWPLGML